MPRRKFIDKKDATTFKLVHRAQNDPLIHDSDASPFVFAEIQAPNAARSVLYPSSSSQSYTSDTSSGKRANGSRNDLDAEFGPNVRHNEGEAAEYGVYYDDTNYDYMQHMRNLGGGAGETVWLDAPSAQEKAKGKQKQGLEDALRDANLDDAASQGGSLVSGMTTSSHAASDIFHHSMLPSEFVKKVSYQDQQNIPDVLSGFKPDMDERLREVLEALEDEAYVDEAEQGDFFDELTGDGEEVNARQWDQDSWEADNNQYEEDDTGWETDDTIKPDRESSVSERERPSPEPKSKDSTEESLPAPGEAPVDRVDTDWQSEFAKFKAGGKPKKLPPGENALLNPQPPSVLTGASSLLSTGRRKKRKGALTSTSGYSMSSSALQRTEAMSLLDERFEKIVEEYADDELPDDGASLNSGMTGMSKASETSRISTMSGASAMRSDFDSLVDDFLGGHSTAGKGGRRVKRGKQQTGMEQLDEIRHALGKVRMEKTPVS